MTNPELEEKLREAACFGDIEGVKELISRGVNTNSQHDINGWTALHWAAKRNHLNIVNLLCNHGADKSVPTNKGEMASDLTSEGVIKVLLNAQASKLAPVPAQPVKATAKVSPARSHKVDPENLPIEPNYLRHPALGYQVDIPDRVDKKPKIEAELPPRQIVQQATPVRRVVSQVNKELILRIRVANRPDPDYIEIELPSGSLTLENLTVTACNELGVQASQVARVRKMPDTRLRRDKEVARLQDYQQVELVLKGASGSGVESMQLQ